MQQDTSTNLVYVDPATNVTMIRVSNLTTGQRSDRIALLVIIGLYVAFHVVFVLWMYFIVRIIAKFSIIFEETFKIFNFF